MSRHPLYVILLCLLCAAPLSAQSGFYMPKSQRQVEIPFEYVNNFIILTITVNNLFPLKFIFDTGAEHTIISKRELTDLMRMEYEREFRVTGSDMKTELIAYLVRRVRFDIPEKVVAPSQDILVLQEDYFRFEEYAGVNVHGILAANVFAKYLIKINYQRRVMTLYERDEQKHPEAGFTEIPVEIFRNKIYLNTKLFLQSNMAVPVKLLVDTGAGLPLLLFSNTDTLVHPPANAIPTNIGMGLGGYLDGFTGRVPGLDLGAFHQQNIITYFQTLDSAAHDMDYLNQRNGLIGNVLLNRFLLLLDYQEEKIWLKPTKAYTEAFVYDRSGLNIIASGPSLNNFTVQSVLPGSPAEQADIRRGDVIMRVGPTPVGLLALADIQRILQKKPGKKIKIVIRRERTRMKKQIVLRELL